jgi:hypothetical protein
LLPPSAVAVAAAAALPVVVPFVVAGVLPGLLLLLLLGGGMGTITSRVKVLVKSAPAMHQQHPHIQWIGESPTNNQQVNH